MPGDYGIIAPLYNRLGMQSFAETMTPHLLNYAQRNDWLGRRILDLGTGTGVSTRWLSTYGYIITAVDAEPQMVTMLRQTGSVGTGVEAHQQDIRKLDDRLGTYDLALALNVMNEMDNLNDLKAVFDSTLARLESGKLLMFDMQTIQGLTQDADAGDRIILDAPDLLVLLRTSYDYERQMTTRRYSIFRSDGDKWIRTEARQILRAYPIQAVAALLQRSGFAGVTVLNTDLSPLDTNTSTTRAIFVAQKG